MAVAYGGKRFPRLKLAKTTFPAPSCPVSRLPPGRGVRLSAPIFPPLCYMRRPRALVFIGHESQAIRRKFQPSQPSGYLGV